MSERRQSLSMDDGEKERGRELPGPAALRAGYQFWGLIISAILLVELAGALRHWLDKHIGVTIPWTTISGMVGHLEDLWPTSAVVVVALLAPAAFYALVASVPDGPPSIPLGSRTELGRLDLRGGPRKPPEQRYDAWVVFGLSAIVGLVAVLIFNDDFVRAYFIYGGLFFFGIVVPHLFVLFKRKEVAFPSLFVTIGGLRARHDWKAAFATVALSAGLAILVVHLAFYPWPDITKAPVRYAGLTANDARKKANREVRRRAGETRSLVYSTQTRGVVNAREAWVVFFVTSTGADSGCIVTLTDSSVDATRQCSA
jgi:hypothetical protein